MCMCMNAGKQFKHAWMYSSRVSLVQMHVMFVYIRFMASCASICPFVSLQWMRSMLCMFTYIHTRSVIFVSLPCALQPRARPPPLLLNTCSKFVTCREPAPGCECSSRSPGFLPERKMRHDFSVRCGHSPCPGARDLEFEQQHQHEKQRLDCEQQVRFNRCFGKY